MEDVDELPVPPVQLRRFDPADWFPPGTVFIGAEGHAWFGRAYAAYGKARLAWCRTHGVTPQELKRRLRDLAE